MKRKVEVLLNHSGKRKEPLPQITRKQRLPRKSIKLMLKLNLTDQMTKVNKKGVVMSKAEQVRNEESNESLYTQARERKLESFKPGLVRELYEELQVDNWALQAFGELLYNSNLESFTDDYRDSNEMRHGLKQIIEMYLDRQQEKLKEIFERSWNCPEHLIESAKSTCEMVMQGAFTTYKVALEHINEAIEDIHLIFSQFGDQEYPKAQKILDDLLNLRNNLKKT